MKLSKVTRLVLKLIKLTKQNKIKWDSHTLKDNELQNGYIVVGKIYYVTIKEKEFELYRYKYKFWKDEDDFEWAYSFRMELIDSKGDSDFELEHVNAMNDLYDIVREQCSQINSLIDDILNIDSDIDD